MNSNSLKFDVVIQGYNWVSSDSNARLALAFLLHGDVSFDIETTAYSGNTAVSVELVDDEDNGTALTLAH